MNEPRNLPADTSADRIRERIASLPDTSFKPAFLSIASGLVAAMAAPIDPTGLTSALAAVGGSLSTWLSSGRQKAWEARLVDVLFVLVEEVDHRARRGIAVQTDAAWAETATRILPLAIDTAREEKRRRFATLLANGSIDPVPARLEECRTMALLLDQLEYAHVELLDRFLSLPANVKHSGAWGTTREIPLGTSNFTLHRDGALLLRMEGIGLLRILEASTRSPESLNKVVQFNELARRFHAWISRPDQAGPDFTAAPEMAS